MKDVEIEIIVRNPNTDEVIAKRTALSFEGAEEDLGKLERYVEKNRD